MLNYINKNQLLKKENNSDICFQKWIPDTNKFIQEK